MSDQVEQSNVKKIRIGSKEASFAFTVTPPYAEGHVCTAAEAAALNQTWCENIGNNMRSKVKDKLPEDGSAPDKKVLKELQAEVDKYASEYVFAARVSTRIVEDPVTKEAKKLAKASIAAALKAKGAKISDVPKEKLDAKIEELVASRPIFMETAKVNVENAKKAAESSLGDLGLD